MVYQRLKDKIAALEAAQKPTAPDPRRIMALVRGESVPDATADERSRATRIKEIFNRANQNH